MNISIFGSCGQLGSDCCTLLSQNHHVTGYDTPDVDITNEASVTMRIEQDAPDVIINCAAYTAVDKCETEKELAWEINAAGPAILAKAAAQHNIRLIHISTDYVYDGTRTPPQGYKETDVPHPLSHYGKSKLAGEEAVKKYAPDHLILRTAWLYSATGQNFLKTMLRLAITDSARPRLIVDDQYGSLTWSYTLARQITKVLTPQLQGIVHATAEGYSTWYQAARYFLDKMNVAHSLRPCTTEQYPTPAHRPTNSILENTRLEDAGISCFVNWKQDLDTFIDKHGEQLLRDAHQKN